MPRPPSGGSTRILSQHPGRVVVVGLRRRALGDLYHGLLTSSWSSLFALLVVLYLLTNAGFAWGYLALGDAIENARPGSLQDAFFFSVQTMATIGYGHMLPRTLAANVLVTAEAVLGMVSVAMMTGLVFAKFARPTAKVLFSKVAVVAPFDGVPSLCFRIANERPNPIVAAQLSVMFVRNETTAEGETTRRVHDLPLRRAQSALFGLTWTAVVPIPRGSPLFGEDAESLDACEAELLVSLTGFEESLSQTVHAHHTYRPASLRFDARFAELVVPRKKGVRLLDFRRFHDVVPLEDPKRAPSEHPRLEKR